MKKHVCAAALALCFVLAACAPEPGASSASVPSSSAAASSLPPAYGTAGQAAPPLDLPYEKIQPVADHATPYPYLACGFDGSGPVYYTMCRGGLWGLMREDFTVVLECRAPQPVARCHLGHWSWGSDGMNWDELDAVNARLSETGDGALEVGHGGSGTLFYWDVAASAPGFCRTGEAAQAPSPVTAADYERYGVFLPVQLSVMAESEMTGGLYPQPIDSAFCYNFAGPAEADAPHLLTEEAYEAVGWFREGLGSVYKNGKTAYLNAERKNRHLCRRGRVCPPGLRLPASQRLRPRVPGRALGLPQCRRRGSRSLPLRIRLSHAGWSCTGTRKRRVEPC